MSCAHPQCTNTPSSGSVYVVDEVEVEIRACSEHIDGVVSALEDGVDDSDVEVYR
ncbi:hypothetical protein EGH21_22345 [Halomicroarcula sp. F13]|uniref:Uncharacterized protein n=1 Tax=Haloarcula rubra TaxID=2487747 RepID=A0AAW4PX65_9EURY|nr:hypothetical protein [Halomicroarcula rubra]MBX0325761.1 hypothetical protein [Halomicroarcula rubra]